MNRLLIRLLGPIFAKEMVEMARRKRYYANRAFYGLALLFALFVIWQDHRWQMESARDLPRVAESLFYGISIVQYLAVFVLVPLFLAGVIASEREEHTLELLFTTQLRDREILLGKLGSRLVMLILLYISGLPVVALIMLFGGVDVGIVLRSMAATFLAILFVAAHAIYFSAATQGAIGALVRTYWWLALLLLGVPLAAGLVLSALMRGGNDVYLGWAMLMINPIFTYLAAVEPRMLEEFERVMGNWTFPLAFVLPTAWSVLLIHWAVRRLRQDPRSLKLPFRGAFAGFGKVSRRFEVSDANPLWQRARRARVYDRQGHVGRIQWAGWGLAIFFLLLLAITEPRAIGDDDCAAAFLVITWIVLAGLTVIFAGNSLVGDRRRGFLDQVLLTPLDGAAIINGTLAAVWQHLLRSIWLPVALSAAFVASGAVPAGELICSLVTGYLACGLFALHAVACSLAARTTPGALVPSFLFPIILVMGVPLLLVWLRDGAQGTLIVGSVVLSLIGAAWVQRRADPAAITCFFLGLHLTLASLATGWVADSTRRGHEFPVMVINPFFWIVNLLVDRRWLGLGTGVYLGALLCYWAATVISLLIMHAWLVRRFDHLVGRIEPDRRAKRSSHPSADVLP